MILFASIFCLIILSTGELRTRIFDGEYEEVYNDHGSGAHYDISIWKQKMDNYTGWYRAGYFLGIHDHCVHMCCVDKVADAGYSWPRVGSTYVIAGDLAAPTGYNKILDDWGSGATKDMSAWEPICPVGYVFLGHMFVPNKHGPPSDDLFRCVKGDDVMARPITTKSTEMEKSGVPHDSYNKFVICHHIDSRCRQILACSAIMHLFGGTACPSGNIYVPKRGYQAIGCNRACVMEEGIDYPGHDISNAYYENVESADKCCEFCQTKVANCKAWTYKDDGGKCWLKDTVPTGATKAGHVSGRRVLNCNFEQNRDFAPTENSEYYSGFTAHSCCERCANTPPCKAFTFKENTTDTNCWLKRWRDPASYKPQHTSGLYSEM